MEILASGFYSMFSGNNDAFIMAWHHDGVMVDGFPILMDNQMIFNSAPTLCDLNGDGKLDIAVGTWKRYPLDEGYVHFFTLDAPYNPDLIEWGQYSHDIQHTGLYAQPEPPSNVDGEETPSNPQLPKSFSLSQNYPNPFNPSTTISYVIPEAVQEPFPVVIRIFSIRGELIRVLDEGWRSSGRYAIHWDGKDQGNREVASGVYIYRLDAGLFFSTKKMVVAK